ncbi:cupin domain-containing protein [Actinokineospora auranticolor]|uniref:Cupin superfamily protein n=1 Tax=Actinokineospora auranticolor TaxID=155976 RepID=A0A2S6GE38_9PSEU|nr:cupin domain-containing protein [Actinokineospora auranticolor]PPK63489.1 Cupin superfamily protein [Actinokineospora auranticolor]
MDHRLVRAVEQALGWNGPQPLGRAFARGAIEDTELCSRLLTPTKLLDAMMRRSLDVPQLRLFKGGKELHPDAFLMDAVTRRGQSTSMAHMDRVGRLIKDGCTVVLDSFDAFDPTMEVACRALQWWAHELVQVNTYLTTNDAAGFNLHWDDHDVLIMQLGGEKSWEVRGASREVPMYRDAEANRTPSEEVVWSGTMRQGDVMHIPRGYWHQATRTDRGAGYSLHITFGFVNRTGVDWLTWLADQSREDPLFRTDLDKWGTGAEKAKQTATLNSAIPELLAKFEPREFLWRRLASRPPHRHVRTFGTFGSARDVVCVTEFPPSIGVDSDRIVVRAAGKEIELAKPAEEATRLLLSGGPVNIADASHMTGLDISELAEVFLDAGLCGELTDELASGYRDLV